MKKTMRAVEALPEKYKEIFSVDLKKDKKAAVAVNLAASAIAVLMAVAMCFVVPLSATFNMNKGPGEFFLRYLAMLLMLVAYIVLHEAVHGVAMKICGTKKVKFGFTGVYAFAGSEDYYGKKAYIFIALAPVVFWGVILAVINFLVPLEWVWIIYFIQIFNVSGAAGDLYVSLRFLRLPQDILVKDIGVSMKVYSGKQD